MKPPQKQTSKQAGTMPITRSMSGATKKIEQVPNGGAKQKSRPKQKEKSSGAHPQTIKDTYPQTIKDIAFDVFRMMDYMKRYHEKHPFPVFPFPLETVQDSLSEWDNMTGADKDKWIGYTKKRFAEGDTLETICLECVSTYNRRN